MEMAFLFNGKLVVITIILACLLAVSAVSAADNDTDEVVGMEMPDDVMGVDCDNQLAGANDFDAGTFDDLTDEINAVEDGGVLNLTKDYRYANGSTGGIKINRSITIDGGGNTLDGKHVSRIFNVTAGNVALKNLKFTNAQFTGNGGAINWNAKDGILSNCTFVGCFASNGGAVYASFSTLRFTDCFFSDNSAVNGACVYVADSIAEFINASFINNSATNASAAIFSMLSLNSIEGCDFINNTVSGKSPFGGAIAFYQYESDISNSRFIGNSINGDYGYGSSIFNYGILNVENTTIVNNTQNTRNRIGDSIYTIIGKANLKGCTIENNSCTGNEDIIYALFWPMVFDKVFDEADTVIPAKYDLRDVTLENGTAVSYVSPIKDQKNSGTCWAFAGIGALESYLLESENRLYNFSENHQKNIMGPYTKGGWVFMRGGGTAKTLAYWSRWSGPVNASDDPFNETSKVSPTNLTVIKHVQDVVYLPVMDIVQLKLAVFKYGSVVIGYKFVQPEVKTINGTTFESEVSPIVSLPQFSSHVVDIVGWDDNYPGSNFGENIPDGAFILKNSFGTSEYSTKLNKTIYYEGEGFNYISYYDMALSKENIPYAIVNVEDVDNYRENYYYDPAGTLVNLGFNNQTAWFSNQFVSNNSYPLAAFSLYTFGVDSAYEAYVYVNDNLSYTQCGVIHNPGYNTVKLSDYVDLKRNDVFRIEIKLTTPNCTYPIPVSCDVNEWIANTSSSPNQSFISPDGINWIDLHYAHKALYQNSGSVSYADFSNAVVCLKAFTFDFGIITQDMVKIYKNDSMFEAKIGEANKIIFFEVDGINHTCLSDENGVAKLEIDLNPGNYTIRTRYANFTAENNIEVLPTLIAKDLVKRYGDKSKFLITLIDTAGNPVANANISMKIDGISYSRPTDKNGKASLDINQKPGKYVLTAVDSITGLEMSYDITVLQPKKSTPKIVANKKTFKITTKTKKYAIALKDNAGKPIGNGKVTLKVGGKTYKATTNSKGKATFKITGLSKKGSYKATVAYNGNIMYNKATKTVKISVIKETPKLTAKAKTFKKSVKTKKYPVTLKTSQNRAIKNAKLSLKVNGKTYFSKTNAKGQATFKITKLAKKGNYGALVKYAGSKYYNAQTVKAKITVK